MGLKYKSDHALDAPERTLEHGRIIQRKKFLRSLYQEWYKWILHQVEDLPKGKIIELGSGGGFLKDLAPDIICSDILDLPTNDLTFSALDMPFDNEELAGIVMIDTLHHIPSATGFLREASRTLRPGGKIVMIEPANSFWGRFIYRNFHHEPFDPSGSWSIPESGPMSGANGALPWIVFERDKDILNTRFPEFEIEILRNHTPLRYLLSGGVAYKSLVPAFSFGFFTLVDRILAGISPGFSMFTSIVVRKS